MVNAAEGGRVVALLSILITMLGFGCTREGPTSPSFPSPPAIPSVSPPPAKRITLVPDPGQLIVEGGGPVYVIGRPAEQQAGARQLAANVSPGSKAKLALQALTCVLEDCPGKGPPGKPFLFHRVYPRVHLDDAGQIVWQKDAGPDTAKWIQGEEVPCPACSRYQGVRPYLPPEVVRRQEELAEELRVSRAVARARRKGQPASGEHRSPKEIMEEISQLPQVYLIQDEDSMK